jgi:hypothetical protein
MSVVGYSALSSIYELFRSTYCFDDIVLQFAAQFKPIRGYLDFIPCNNYSFLDSLAAFSYLNCFYFPGFLFASLVILH